MIFLLLFASVSFYLISAQCPGVINCEDAYVFCSLDEMNGFSCTTSNTFSIPCKFHCQNSSFKCPRTWWSFISQGGNVTIKFTVGTCMPYNGMNPGLLSFGIWGDCNCTDKIDCIPFLNTGYSAVFQVNLKPCKKYYISIDGNVHNDTAFYCDFTISTSGGGSPMLSPLSDINNIPSGIIEPVCVGQCDVPFHVNTQTGSCADAYYVWTLDGVEVGGNSNDIKLDFPIAGDFKICVSVYLGNPKSGAICAQEGPKCATVKVRPLPDKVGTSRTICYEAANPFGYKWLSQNIMTSGIYREHYINKNCCGYDSVVQFTVLPIPEPADVYYISCDNKPFIDIMGHKWSPCLDRFVIKLPKTTDPFKCDSSIRLTAVNVDFSPQWQAKCVGGKVELSPNCIILKSCGAGETYQFDYKWYKKNDTTKIIIGIDDRLLVATINEDYCVEVNLRTDLGTTFAICSKTFCDTVNEAIAINTTENIKESYCDSAVINGQTYKQTTQFTQQLKNVFGCDSIVNTEIRIQKSSKTDLTFNSCDSVVVNGISYAQSGNYIQILQNTNLCDSILNLEVSLQNNNKTDLIYNECDSVVVNGQTYTQSGSYLQNLISSNGCDSILNLDISVQKSRKTDFSFNACDSVFFNGKTYTKSGNYPQTFTGVNGCDSIVDIHINITNSNNSPLKISYCDSATINGMYYNQSGNYTQKLTSANGCDSTLNIQLTIAKSNSFVYNFSSCDSAVINGQKYLQSGLYTQTLQNSDHCDSTLNINLNVLTSSSLNLVFSDCDSVILNNRIYTTTGVYNQILSNANGCDSVLTIDFTKLSSSSSNLNFISCDSVIVNKQTYNQSGNYTQTLANSNHCDSTLNLSVIISNSNSSNLSLSSCDSAIVNGQNYFQTGNYIQVLQNTNLCDSILNINLTIFKKRFLNYLSASCDSATINGQIYKQSGSYTQYLKTINHCDSILNIQVNLLKSTTSTFSQNICDSVVINGIKYNSTGSYLQKLINSNGCDSTLTLDLTIKPGNPSTLDAGTDTSICAGEIIQLNGIFFGQAKFIWNSSNGSFDNPNNLITNYHPTSIGDERIYLQANDDCKQWLDSLAVHVLPKQIVQVTGDTILNPCKEISFTASGGTNYIWTPSSVIECLDPACSRVRLKSTTNLMFTISTDGPCVVPTTLNLSLAQIQSEVYVPNVFSPNGDNINDVFLPIFNCDQVDYYNLQIFDRWGNLVFESLNKDKGWNGKYQDVNMNRGVYPYVVQYQLHGAERKLKAGDVTLIK